jgi:hypothetical protein
MKRNGSDAYPDELDFRRQRPSSDFSYTRSTAAHATRWAVSSRDPFVRRFLGSAYCFDALLKAFM